MKTSIRFRLTALVAGTFAVVLVLSSLMFLNWFEDQMVEDVRADDAVELQRQVEIIAALDDLASQVNDFLDPEDMQQPLRDEDFPVAIIPDDGTIISIANADGLELTDSTQSFRILTSSGTAASDAAGESASDDGLTEAQAQEGLNQAPDFVRLLRTELSADTLETYAMAMLLLDDAFLDEDTPDGDELAAGNEFSAALNEMFFAFDTAPSGEGRLITSTQQTSVAGISVTITATSRVTNIDAALDSITRTLWVAIPVLIALAAGLTYLATGRALQPVDALTRQVEAITSARSGDRVPEPDTGDEIHQLAVTMNGMLGRLETSALSQRRFVSDVSHELRTPSAVIRAEIEAGLADTENDWPKTAESVLAEQGRLSGLVDDLLLLARMDEGGESRHVDIDLDALVQQEAGRGWAHDVDARGVEPVRIRGEERQVGRLIQNLVANANRHAVSRVELTLRAVDGHAVLWVDDDGLGVPAGERERVFERFARLDESRERDLGGSGLGLAIVKEVAEAHGGTAIITNSPLGGARVEVTLAR